MKETYFKKTKEDLNGISTEISEYENFIETLREDADGSLSKIYRLPDSKRYRCHEVARLLKDYLEKQGYEDLIVKDGIVEYSPKFLVEKYFQKDSELTYLLEEQALEEDQNKKSTGKIIHSWIEQEDIVIDYHPILEISQDISAKEALIVEEKKKLAGKAYYNPCGKEFEIFGKGFIWVYPFNFIKLEM